MFSAFDVNNGNSYIHLDDMEYFLGTVDIDKTAEKVANSDVNDVVCTLMCLVLS